MLVYVWSIFVHVLCRIYVCIFCLGRIYIKFQYVCVCALFGRIYLKFQYVCVCFVW